MYLRNFIDQLFSVSFTTSGCGVLIALLSSGAAWAQNCSDCHSEAGQQLSSGAHTTVECSNCHIEHEEVPHPEGATTLECGTCHSDEADQTALGVHGQARARGNEAAPDCSVCHGTAHEVALVGTTPFRRTTIETCGMCHFDEGEQFQQSVHGQAVAAGNRDAPTCNSCHGEHAIQPTGASLSPVQGANIRETCGDCHGDLALTSQFGLPADRVLSFDASFHGLASRAGSQTVANCASCHGIHDILPSSDPRSSIHPDNLPETCGACHEGAGTRFALGPIHVVEGEGQAPIADLIRTIYLVLIPIIIGLMFLHNAGDWVRKVRARIAGSLPPAPRLELRMLPAERIQHALLAVSFLVLVWTGFALKFPDEWWAYPLVVWEASWPVRGQVHRIAAAIFMATAVYHAITLVASKRLRDHWKQLLPAWSDVREGWAAFRYNLGLTDRRPEISSHSYIEKAEYWAVVWGGVLMSISGIILWANDFFLRYAPKALMDIATVVHYYEAILAALAIVVWHFYSVIFDPSVYPMSFAWITGYGPGRKGEGGQSEDPTEPQADRSSGSTASSGGQGIRGIGGEAESGHRR